MNSYTSSSKARTIQKIVAIITIPLICFLFLNIFYMRSDSFIKNGGIDKFSRIPDQIYLSAFGSSHEMDALRFDLLNDATKRTFNFALASQTIYYDAKIAERFINNLVPGGIALIGISYFSFYRLEIRYPTDTPRYYRFLKPSAIHDWNLDNQVRFGWLPLLTARAGILEIAGLDQNTEKVTDAPQDDSGWKKLGLQRAIQHITDMESIGFQQERIHDLESLILILKSHGVHPILVMTPLTPEYDIHFSENYRQSVLQTLLETSIRETIPFLDYSRNPVFVMDRSLFKDADHLNSKGSKKFLATVIPDAINALGLKNFEDGLLMGKMQMNDIDF